MANRIGSPSVLDELRRNLERLKLRAMVLHLDEALEQAVKLEQGYIAFLAGIVGREVLARGESSTIRRMNAAKFPAVKTFDSFDWTFQKGMNVQLVKDLMNLQFIDQGRPVLLLGRPGTGKTHLSISYASSPRSVATRSASTRPPPCWPTCTPPSPTAPPSGSSRVWRVSTC